MGGAGGAQGARWPAPRADAAGLALPLSWIRLHSISQPAVRPHHTHTHTARHTLTLVAVLLLQQVADQLGVKLGKLLGQGLDGGLCGTGGGTMAGGPKSNT